jgi:hypothetical protein
MDFAPPSGKQGKEKLTSGIRDNKRNEEGSLASYNSRTREKCRVTHGRRIGTRLEG